MNTNNNKLGISLVFLSAIMFGSYGVWSRLIGDAMGSFFQGWTRALIILILIVPIVLIRKEFIKIKKEGGDWLWLGVFLLFTSLTQAPIYYAFTHMDIGTASLLFFVSMFLTMNAVGYLFLGERMNVIKIISMGLAFMGMYLVFSFSLSVFALFAAVMAIVNGIASGGEVAFSKKLSNSYSPLYLSVLSWSIILVSNCIISLIIGESQVGISLSLPWFWQLCYSLVSLFAFWLVMLGFKYVDASIGSLIGLLEIVFSILFGMILFKESLTLSIALGGLLIIIAAALPSLQEFIAQRKIQTT